MQSDLRMRMIKIGLGLLVVTAAILGGDTVSNFNGDILIIATLLLFAFALSIVEISRIGYVTLVFAGVAIIHIALQLVPFGYLSMADFGLKPEGMFFTGSFIETFRALISFIVVLFVFFTTLSLGYSHARGLLSFLYVALYCNLVIGLFQFSSGLPVGPGVFGYTLAGGFFINQNHFSTFLAMLVPFLILGMMLKVRQC